MTEFKLVQNHYLLIQIIKLKEKLIRVSLFGFYKETPYKQFFIKRLKDRLGQHLLKDIKQILFNNNLFGEQNPGFDFSGAQINGRVPEARTFLGGVKYT